ncbi:hypothetical protein GJ496_011567 [Pomphorhynchus laevis]|nr:hypothetical protein GJ496_011567 [Pomphorhynchus laevis]
MSVNSLNKQQNTYLQRKVYIFLEKPSGPYCFLYNILLLVITIFSIIFNSLVSIPKLATWTVSYICIIDYLLFLIFLIEYICRIWSVGCSSKYAGVSGRIKFAFKPLCILDLIAIIGLSVCISYKFTYEINPPNFIIIRSMRFLQLARLFHFDRYVTSWRILWSVFQEHMQELITIIYFAFVFLVIVSYTLWLAERNQINSSFSSYGDRVPQTFIGKTIISTVGIFGVFLWALPSGIIGSGFALKIREDRKKRKYIRLQPSAAFLIQSWWRLIMAKRNKSDILCRMPEISSSLNLNESNFDITWSSNKLELAVRYIRLLKFFAAKSKFFRMRKPRNVINALNESSRNYWKLMQLSTENIGKTSLLLNKLDQTITTASVQNCEIIERIKTLEIMMMSLKSTNNEVTPSMCN